MEITYGRFIWDFDKEQENIQKHGINFTLASQVFEDSERQILMDHKHSLFEERLFCIGKVRDQIMTVRFTYRRRQIRIIGAGYWRRGKAYYEEKN